MHCHLGCALAAFAVLISGPLSASARGAENGSLLSRLTGAAAAEESDSDALRPDVEEIDWSLAPARRWSGRVGAIILNRGGLPSQPFVFNSNTGQNYLDPSDYSFPWRAGADVSLIRYGQFADVDFRYFGVDPWTSQLGPVQTGPGTTASFPDIGASANPLTVSAGYTSRLQSVETNLRKNVAPRWSLLAGFRYLSFTDGFQIIADEGPANGVTQIGLKAHNSLYGGQIGADGILWDNGGRFRIESAIKAGVYGNVTKDTLSIGDGSGGMFNAVVARNNHTAFVGDLSFTGVYQWNDNWSLRAGYQLLWLAGVAIGSEQPPGIDFNNGVAAVDTSGSAFFHGVTLGLERSW